MINFKVMPSTDDHAKLLEAARGGDIRAFQQLFANFQPELRSYLYRLLASRHDAEDLSHDTFVKAYEALRSFRGEASLKTWVFRIATNLAYDELRRQQRWPADAQDRAKALAQSRPDIQQTFARVHATDPQGAYNVREHIDFCFTCIGKTLPIEQQVAVILKDVYQFRRSEIARVLGMTEGVVKHLLYDGRKTLSEVFYQRCALVNKQGSCHQCSELAGIYNPRQARQRYLRGLEISRAAAAGESQQGLYALRARLVRFIDPLTSNGASLQDAIMECTREAIGAK